MTVQNWTEEDQEDLENILEMSGIFGSMMNKTPIEQEAMLDELFSHMDKVWAK